MTDHNREEREALIEKAARAILARSWGLGTMESARADAEIAFTIFEQAHTPTSDEPVAYGIYGRVTGRLKYVQVMDEHEVEEQSEFYDVVPLFRRTVQGEPTDAAEGTGQPTNHEIRSHDA